MRELCPRSYDVVERAELSSVRIELYDSKHNANISESSHIAVTIQQDPDLGIPGVVYDCSIVLAQFVSSLNEQTRTSETKSTYKATKTVKIIELGCGVGTCGLLVAVSLARKGTPIDLTLTDRNAKALVIAERNAEALKKHPSYGHLVTTCCEKYVFGDDLNHLIGTTSGTQPDIILASDVLYDPDTAKALATTLKRMLTKRTDTKSAYQSCQSVMDSPDGRPVGVGLPNLSCYLAWRPRPSNSAKQSALQAFLKTVADIGLSAVVEDVGKIVKATRTVTSEASRLTTHSDETNKKWSKPFDVRDAIERGLTILKIEERK